MKKYDYRAAMVEDIKDYIKSNDIELRLEDDEFSTYLYDELFCEDNITGNGAFFYDTENKCSEYLSDNFDLLYEAIRDFGMLDDAMGIIKHYENRTLARYFDCTIRCYLLGECLDQALEELK